MKQKSLLISAAILILIGAVLITMSVLGIKTYQRVNLEECEKGIKELKHYQDSINSVNYYKIYDLETDYSVLAHKQIVSEKKYESLIMEIRKELNENSMLTKEALEDIFFLNKKYWESDEVKRLNLKGK